MRKLLFFLALTVIHIGAKTIVGSPTVEINSQGVYLVEIKISGDETLVEDDILITNFKSNELLSDIKFDYQIFESLGGYKRITLGVPENFSEDYLSFRLNLRSDLKKDVFIFLPQNNIAIRPKTGVSFKLPAKKIYGKPQRYDIAKILAEEPDYNNDPGTNPSSSLSILNPGDNKEQDAEKTSIISSSEVETIWSVAELVRQNYDASIYQIMWGFYLENPNAFIDENINLVRGDVDLTMPSEELIASTSNFDAKESIAFMNLNSRALKQNSKPSLKLTAPIQNLVQSAATKEPLETGLQSKPVTMLKNSDNALLNASEIVAKNTSILELDSASEFEVEPTNAKNTGPFKLQDLFWVGLLSLFAGFVIAFVLVRLNQKPIFAKSALEEDLLNDDETFQSNLSISNDIETQELDLVRTYIGMGDWESANKILDKLIANSSDSFIISEARSLLEQSK